MVEACPTQCDFGGAESIIGDRNAIVEMKVAPAIRRATFYTGRRRQAIRIVAPLLRKNPMTQQVTIIATLYAKAGQEDALAARMHEMARATREEAGCILYELQRSIDDPFEFIMVEYWRDAEAVALHDASAHMAALVADLPALVDRPVAVRKYTPA